MKNSELIYISAGEESGDSLGAEVVRELKKIDPAVRIKGIGGKHLAAEGMETIFRTEKLGFMGFIELIRHIFVIRKAMKAITDGILKDRPAVVLLIDFSEFHIKLAKRIKSALPHTRIIKYVSPQIWASRPGRIADIAKYYDCLCCILPFESELYDKYDIDCRYVGHPMLDKFFINTGYEEFNDKFNFSADKTLISVFPGSRKQEIKKHLPVLKKFMEEILKRSDVEIAVCRSSNLKSGIFDRYDLPEQVRIIPSVYQWELMEYSGIVLCKSGTATIQTAITQTPSVVFYKVNPVSYAIAKMIVKTKFISLPNIIAGKQINPELIQSDFSPEKILYETLKLLDKPDIYSLRKQELRTVRDMLGNKGAAATVAQITADYINM
jgi:lipid-A-disaccharide synthase